MLRIGFCRIEGAVLIQDYTQLEAGLVVCLLVQQLLDLVVYSVYFRCPVCREHLRIYNSEKFPNRQRFLLHYGAEPSF